MIVYGRPVSILVIVIRTGSHPLWHPAFETMAYAVGYWVFRRERTRQGDVLAEPQRWTIIAAAAVGALAGSRLLGLAEQCCRYLCMCPQSIGAAY